MESITAFSVDSYAGYGHGCVVVPWGCAVWLWLWCPWRTDAVRANHVVMELWRPAWPAWSRKNTTTCTHLLNPPRHRRRHRRHRRRRRRRRRRPHLLRRRPPPTTSISSSSSPTRSRASQVVQVLQVLQAAGLFERLRLRRSELAQPVVAHEVAVQGVAGHRTARF